MSPGMKLKSAFVLGGLSFTDALKPARNSLALAANETAQEKVAQMPMEGGLNLDVATIDFCTDHNGELCSGCLLIADAHPECDYTMTKEECVRTYVEQTKSNKGPRGAWCGACNIQSWHDADHAAHVANQNANNDNDGASSSPIAYGWGGNIPLVRNPESDLCETCLIFGADGSVQCSMDMGAGYEIYTEADCHSKSGGSWCPLHRNYPLGIQCRNPQTRHWCDGCMTIEPGKEEIFNCNETATKEECVTPMIATDRRFSPEYHHWCPSEPNYIQLQSCTAPVKSSDSDPAIPSCSHGCLARFTDGSSACLNDVYPGWRESTCEHARVSGNVRLSTDPFMGKVIATTHWCGNPEMNCHGTHGGNEGAACNACWEHTTYTDDGSVREGCNTYETRAGCLAENYQCMFHKSTAVGIELSFCHTAWCPDQAR